MAVTRVARVAVALMLPDGREVVLVPGDLIGRMARAQLRIEDPRISEAHALVSLRGAELRLLALRGRLGVDGKARTEVKLAPGVRVVLGGYLPLVVGAVHLPRDVPLLAVERDGVVVAEAPLDGVLALHASPPHLVSGFDPDASATAWPGDAGAYLRAPDVAADRLLRPGDAARVGSFEVRLRLAARDSDHNATLEGGRFEVALTLLVHYDTVHVRPAEGPTLVVDGIAARLLSELAAIGTPVAWNALAATLWPGEDDLGVLRQRWDKTTSRLRKRLADARLRHDLVRANHVGLVELFLGPDDRVEDHS